MAGHDWSILATEDTTTDGRIHDSTILWSCSRCGCQTRDPLQPDADEKLMFLIKKKDPIWLPCDEIVAFKIMGS